MLPEELSEDRIEKLDNDAKIVLESKDGVVEEMITGESIVEKITGIFVRERSISASSSESSNTEDGQGQSSFESDAEEKVVQYELGIPSTITANVEDQEKRAHASEAEV